MSQRDRDKTNPSRPERRRTQGSPAERDALRDAFAGVKPLGGSNKRAMPPSDRPTRPSRPRSIRSRAAASFTVVRDRDGSVVGKREGTHRSILDALEDPKLEFDDECDLHGMTSAAAAREVSRFIRQAQSAGDRWVLVIVGKGLHSPSGKATLRERMIEALSSGVPSRYVLAFGTATRRHGGSGALAIRLVDRL